MALYRSIMLWPLFLVIISCGQRGGPVLPMEGMSISEEGDWLVVTSHAQGRNADQAQASAVEAALAEAARMRSVAVETEMVRVVQETRTDRRGADGVSSEGVFVSQVTDRARLSAAASLRDYRVRGRPEVEARADGQVQVRLQVVLPLIQVYPHRYLAAARRAAAVPQALRACAMRFEEAGMSDWALAAWLELARHPQSSPADQLTAAEGCERLHHRLPALRIASATREVLRSTTSPGADLRRADILVDRLSAAASTVESWRLMRAHAASGRRPELFQASQRPRRQDGVVVHWQVGGEPRRLLTLWSDGEDCAWLRLQNERPFTGLAQSRIAVGPEVSGVILAWAVPPHDPSLVLVEALPPAGIPLSDQASIEQRLLLEALHEAVSRSGHPSAVLQIGP